jgi:hypothetical protein
MWLMGRDYQVTDMSAYGGPTDAIVKWAVIQEQDENHQVLFHWHSQDWLTIEDTAPRIDLTAPLVDLHHANSFALDEDGNLLVSFLALEACLKIDRTSGEILWALGHPEASNINEFTYINDPYGGFSAQHDFNNVGGNRYTVFDNGRENTPKISRAVEYELDTELMTATMVWSHQHPSGTYASHQGNAQRLASGDTCIGWGNGDLAGSPSISVVTPEGRTVVEVTYQPAEYHSYRARLLDFAGGYARTPYLVVEVDEEAEEVILTFNVFHHFREFPCYRIYHDTAPQPETLVLATQDRQVVFTELPTGMNYFRVRAIADNGEPSDYSNEEEVDVPW